MNSYPQSAPESVLATDSHATTTPVACPLLSAAKAQAKALKKWRKHERIRLFLGWCASCHALGFSF